MKSRHFFEHYTVVAAPHEVLGLSPDERTPAAIVDAARWRLQVVVADTSDTELRDMLCGIIRKACQSMLLKAERLLVVTAPTLQAASVGSGFGN